MHEEPEGAVVGDLEGRGTAAEPAQEPLDTVHLSAIHKIENFTCRSENVQKFLQTRARQWVADNYCRVFIYANPDDPTEIWGYYSISPFVFKREGMIRAHRNRLRLAEVPMILIGYMGRDANLSPKSQNFGAGLIFDAARRASRNPDIASWGLILAPEGGPANQGLWKWYAGLGFTPVPRPQDAGPEVPYLMYAPYPSLIPKG